MNRARAMFPLLVLALSGCCDPGPTETLTVTLRPQETSMWCWAASGQMVMEYHGTSVSQCTQANNRFGRTDCPCGQCGPTPVPQVSCAQGSCVCGGWPEFAKYGFDFTRTTNQALSWSQLRDEISRNSGCGNRPFAFTWAWTGNGGHMMVAHGYQTVDGTDFVSILDPWSPCNGDARIITYAHYVSGPNYSHWDDFYQVRPN